MEPSYGLDRFTYSFWGELVNLNAAFWRGLALTYSGWCHSWRLLYSESRQQEWVFCTSVPFIRQRSGTPTKPCNGCRPRKRQSNPDRIGNGVTAIDWEHTLSLCKLAYCRVSRIWIPYQWWSLLGVYRSTLPSSFQPFYLVSTSEPHFIVNLNRC